MQHAVGVSEERGIFALSSASTVGSPSCARGEGWSALQTDKAAWGSAVFLNLTGQNGALISI